jgi:seryl-tRNA synthetase
MNLIADFLLAAGAFSAAVYCLVLSRRLKRFTTLETGMGGAIAVLSAQVDDMTKALEGARRSAQASFSGLENQVQRAEAASARLDLILASLHDLPEETAPREEDTQDEKRLRFVRRRPDRTGLRAAE